MAIDVVQITDHAARAEARLAEQYKRAEKLKGLLACFTVQCQQIEDMLFGVLLGYRLSLAVGEQLDVLGRVVGQDRESADDTEYRLRLAARIRANLSHGSAEDVYLVFGILLPTATLAIEVQYPASFVLQIHGALTEALVPLYARFLADTKAAGVGGQGVYTLVADSSAFTFSSVADFGVDGANRGWADTAQTSGGRLAGVFG